MGVLGYVIDHILGGAQRHGEFFAPAHARRFVDQEDHAGGNSLLFLALDEIHRKDRLQRGLLLTLLLLPQVLAIFAPDEDQASAEVPHIFLQPFRYPTPKTLRRDIAQDHGVIALQLAPTPGKALDGAAVNLPLAAPQGFCQQPGGRPAPVRPEGLASLYDQDLWQGPNRHIGLGLVVLIPRVLFGDALDGVPVQARPWGGIFESDHVRPQAEIHLLRTDLPAVAKELDTGLGLVEDLEKGLEFDLLPLCGLDRSIEGKHGRLPGPGRPCRKSEDLDPLASGCRRSLQCFARGLVAVREQGHAPGMPRRKEVVGEPEGLLDVRALRARNVTAGRVLLPFRRVGLHGI